jgi:hypothetical protein
MWRSKGSLHTNPTPPVVIAGIKRKMLWGIALLWLIDAGLQAQPQMFTVDFVSNIMKPSIAINPSFMESLSKWTLGWISPHIAEFNWVFTCVQFFIAITLLVGLLRRHQTLIKVGLLVSIGWGLSVWVFGEGTSGVFTGNGTLLTGAPGSVLLYVFIAVFYLLPDKWWQLSSRFCLPRDALAIIFLYGALAQVLTPGFWGSQGIAVLVEGQAAMAPSWMLSTLEPVVTLSHSDPILWNGLYSVALLAIAGLMFGRKPKTVGFVLLGIVLLAMWYWGQAIGGVFSGMGTDPNTPPLFALMALPAWVKWRARRQMPRPTIETGHGMSQQPAQ